MKVERLTLENFRNISAAQIEADSGINVFYGQNAQGKTNLLEAIWLFTGAKSFRGAKDSEFLKFGAPFCRNTIDFYAEERQQTAEMIIEKKRKVKLNGVEQASASDLAGRFTAIVFSPKDLSVISDGPRERRRLLDMAICQLYPEYIGISREYLRAVTQRNFLLKSIKYNDAAYDLLEDLEEIIAQKGAKIITYRQRYIKEICKYLSEIYCGISAHREEMVCGYETAASEDIGQFKEALRQARREDLKTYTTSVGPHRDDLAVQIDGLAARTYGSQGQRRSAALALKLAEAEVINSITGERPVALLDDVMSELDEKRQNYILNHIKNWQVFITCCELHSVDRLQKGKAFYVQNGQIQ